MLDDPLIDWLQLYGKKLRLHPRDSMGLATRRTWIFWSLSLNGEREFEAGILRLFRQRHDVDTIAQDYRGN